jgi:DNA-binding YbaB/EbfC family protein
MVNMMKMMKQAADMQKNVERVQAELAAKDVEFSAGGGAVTVVASGDMTIKSIKIDPQAVDPEEVDVLEDLVLAGVDGALKKAKDMVAEEMAKVTAGLGLPGMPPL